MNAKTLAAVSIMPEHLPELKIRVVNVVDLMQLQPPSEQPHRLPDIDFDALCTWCRSLSGERHGWYREAFLNEARL